MESKGSGFSISSSDLTSLQNTLNGFRGYYGRGESKWIDDVAAIIGKQQINLVVDETLKIAGAVIANAERNADGSLTDKGKLYIKAAEVITESIYGYDDGILLGASFSGGASSGSSLIGNSYGAQFGYTDKTQEVHTAMGDGIIDAPIKGEHTRDINNIKEEDGIVIDPIKIEYTQVNYDKVREISTDENSKFSFAKVGEHMAQSMKNSYYDVMSIFSKAEKVAPPKQEEVIIEEEEKEVKENQEEKVKESKDQGEVKSEARAKDNKNQISLHPDEAKKLRVFEQYVTLLVDNGISKQEAEKTVAQLIIENEYQATKTVQVAVLPFALAAAVQGMEFISAIILAKVVGDKLAETYPKLKGAINNKIIDIQNKEENIALEKSRNDGHSNSAKKDIAGTKAAAGAPDPDDPEDPRNNKKWKEWTKNEDGKWHHPEAKDFEGIPNRPNAQNEKLQKLYNELWRPKNEIPGGTAQILREEARAGHFNPRHLQKSEEMIRGIDNILSDSKQFLSKLDRETANRVKNDLQNAVDLAWKVQK